MEIYGKVGKLSIEGLGGSYGMEKLTWYKMLPQMGPPETTAWEYPMEDDSWRMEFAAFLEEIKERREPARGVKDALAALQVVKQIYDTCGYSNWTMGK